MILQTLNCQSVIVSALMQKLEVFMLWSDSNIISECAILYIYTDPTLKYHIFMIKEWVFLSFFYYIKNEKFDKKN